MKSEAGGSEEVCDVDDANLLERVVNTLCIGGAALAAASVLIILCIAGANIFMRYVLANPINWFDELSGYLVVAIVMFGAAEALRKNDHIQIDILTSRLHGRALDALRSISIACVIVLMMVLLFGAWQTVKFSYEFGLYSNGYMEIPMWIPQSLLIAGSALVLLAVIAKISRALRTAPSAGGD